MNEIKEWIKFNLFDNDKINRVKLTKGYIFNNYPSEYLDILKNTKFLYQTSGMMLLCLRSDTWTRQVT